MKTIVPSEGSRTRRPDGTGDDRSRPGACFGGTAVRGSGSPGGEAPAACRAPPAACRAPRARDGCTVSGMVESRFGIAWFDSTFGWPT